MPEQTSTTTRSRSHPCKTEHVFHGKAFGKIGTTSGEICFNTGMTGYQEVFTDPSYYRAGADHE